MQLSRLLKQDLPAAADVEISGIARDSRLVKQNYLYCALKGARVDGADFIAEAIASGACAVLREGEKFQIDYQAFSHHNIPLITLPELSAQLGIIAAEFYDNPSQHLTVIAITGTNGKTSTALYTAQALNRLGISCGVIGTLGSGLPDSLLPDQHTTPEPISLQAKLAQFVGQGIKAVAMEASSHGLAQRRMAGVSVDIAVFTNLSRDHLDYHHTVENYKQAKRLLFTEFGAKYAVINMDDEMGEELVEDFNSKLTVYGYSVNGRCKKGVLRVAANNLQQEKEGFSMDIDTPWGHGSINTPLLGRFNASNLLAVVTVLGIMGKPVAMIAAALREVVAVPGRMQKFGGGKKPVVIVDYAHTPDALEQVLTELRAHTKGRLWCIFGCGGDRDQGKRPVMGAIAERLADQIVLTNDNPRSENPETIANEILAGMVCAWAAEIELDRHAAIAHAINCAGPEDVVLIAGKGHEPYQIIGDQRIMHDDREVVEAQLNS